MTKFRAFIAIDIEVTNKIKDIIKDLEKSDANLKIVEPEKMHITLKFLGDTEEKQVKNIKTIIENIVENIDPFKVKLKDTGVFPNENYMRIIWIGLKNYDKIVEIANKLDNEISKLGFKKEKRKFSPHVTIARVRSGKNKEKLLQILNRYKDIDFLDLEIKDIKIKKSVLTKKGPIYTNLEQINFNQD